MAKASKKKVTAIKSAKKAAPAAVKKPAKKAAQVSKKPLAKSATKKTTATTKKVAVKSAVRSAVKPGQKAAAQVTKPAAKSVAAKKPAPKASQVIAQKPVAPRPATIKPAAMERMPHQKPPIVVSPNAKRSGFTVGEYVVYPTHGVGKILGFEVEKIGDYELKVFVIAFEKDKMTLRVPVGRAEAAGLRGISSGDQITRAIQTLKGRAKIARGMWSRRAQEYEAKINSGNLIQIAEVVRDLHKNVDQSERSYSERMIYETAFHRLVGEYAASEKMEVKDAHDKLLKLLRKQAALAAEAAAA
jgi:CarD family transcriptional regulator